jgi:hypothetical protein
MSVRFIEETGGQEKIFDFTAVDTEPGLRQWLARVLARRVSARSATKRIKTVESHFGILRMFAASLATADKPVRTPADLTTSHVTAFCEHHAGLKSQGIYIDQLRSLLRDDPEIPDEVRTALVRAKVPRVSEPQTPKDPGYSDADWQLIMTALRRDVRLARDRIRAGRELLRHFRAGGLVDEKDADVAELLDVFDRTGEFPRRAEGGVTGRVNSVRAIASRLCLTLHEMTAFALLLTAMTGENFGTVANWPAISYRPDGARGDGPGIALLEAVKPRRGPEREHMVTPLEDLPPSLAEILSTSTEDDRLFRSPLRAYHLLLELTEVTRRHGGHPNAFSAYALTPGPLGTSHWIGMISPHHVVRWARSHGFPNAESSSTAGKPAVNVRRIRQSVIERRRRPIAHTRQTMNDRYLMPSSTIQHNSQEVVAAALRAEVAKARKRNTVPVFTASFVTRAEEDPIGTAAEAGLEPEVLKGLLTREQDTALASCTDHLAGPHSEPGTPCPASFLNCLDCENARALPHQLPVQIAATDRIVALRAHVDPALWRARYEPRLAQLDDIVTAYPPAERERARQALTDTQQRMVDELLEGRWDLR